MRYLVDFESFVVQANTYDEAWRKAKIIAHEHDWDLDDELLSGKEWCENDDEYIAVWNTFSGTATAANKFAKDHNLEIIEMVEV